MVDTLRRLGVKDKKKYNEYHKIYMNKRYRIRREKAINELGGKCVECGSVERLNFHHLKDKKFAIANGSYFSEGRWQEELKKCILLCKDCHMDEHRQKNHGTIAMYRYCKCNECREVWNKHSREYRRLRKERIFHTTGANRLQAPA